jgi:glucose-1-phosphate cytidylyltransferase
MKAVILAGGLGTRLSEETSVRPKPMVEIGGHPILWHVLKLYSAHGINDFIICAGYKGWIIKEYFASLALRSCDVTFDIARNRLTVHDSPMDPWCVTVADTGAQTMTGGRLRRVRDYVGDETFCLTYGDGVGDVDIGALVEFHRAQGRSATLTAVQPEGRFGLLGVDAESSAVTQFREKRDGDGAWVNGGFFVLEPDVFDLIDGDDSVWEREPLQRLSAEGRLSAYRHTGFWHPMDTLRDKEHLEQLWQSGQAPWRVW